MDNKKQGACSCSSSVTADLFGTKESPPSSSSGVFASIFPPPSTVLGKKSSSSEVLGYWQKQPFGNQVWSNKKGTPDSRAMNYEGASYKSSIFQDRGVEPCNLSSSLLYGGQDNCSQFPSTQANGSYPMFKKDGEEDDPNPNNSEGASRGNWWQGSLYY